VRGAVGVGGRRARACARVRMNGGMPDSMRHARAAQPRPTCPRHAAAGACHRHTHTRARARARTCPAPVVRCSSALKATSGSPVSGLRCRNLCCGLQAAACAAGRLGRPRACCGGAPGALLLGAACGGATCVRARVQGGGEGGGGSRGHGFPGAAHNAACQWLARCRPAMCTTPPPPRACQAASSAPRLAHPCCRHDGVQGQPALHRVINRARHRLVAPVEQQRRHAALGARARRAARPARGGVCGRGVRVRVTRAGQSSVLGRCEPRKQGGL
jgi:hypothetical protein